MELLTVLDDALSGCAEFATSTIGIVAICLLIVTAALGWYWLGFRRRISPLTRDLRRACFVIEEVEGPAEFAAAFHDLDERIVGNRLLNASWREFKQTLLFPESDDDQVVGSVQPPGYHFRRDALLGQRLNLRLYNAIPNLLTGAGILGTFIGLVAGIYLASHGLASDDINEAKSAMQALLNGASLAFITSIVGLLSSIIFSIFEKHRVHDFDAFLGRWIGGLEKRLQRVTPEGIARQQLVQARQQTEVIQGFTDQLAFQIADAFDQKLQEHIAASVAPALMQLVQGIEGLRLDRRQSDEAVLERLLTRFTSELNGAAGTEMESLATTLSELNSKLQEQTTAAEAHHRANQEAAEASMERLSRLFTEGTERFQEHVTNSVGMMSESMEKVLAQLTQQQNLANADANKRIKVLGEAFNQAIAGLQDTLGQMREISASNHEAARMVNSLVQGLDEAAQRIQGLSAPIQKAAEQFERTGDGLSRQVEALGKAAGMVSNATAELQASNSETRAAWVDYRERFEGIDKALDGAFAVLTEGVQAFTTQVGEVLGQLDQHTAEITGKLGGAIQELGETVEELNDTVSRLRPKS